MLAVGSSGVGGIPESVRRICLIDDDRWHSIRTIIGLRGFHKTFCPMGNAIIITCDVTSGKIGNVGNEEIGIIIIAFLVSYLFYLGVNWNGVVV